MQSTTSRATSALTTGLAVRVGAYQMIHFACRIHYELRDVVSERLIDGAEVPEPCGQDPSPVMPPLPAWVVALRAHRP